ncbi:MAG: trehalose-6-phosphate synthase [Rubrobacteraceae bacterium]|nr:trehalose-6-phosphate synthase [Rubrobacteraceae bacterium]
MPGGRFVIVSNRGPFAFSRDESGKRTYARGAGGLVTALTAVARRSEGSVWLASATTPEDVEVARLGEVLEVEELRVRLVEHDEGAYDMMYNRIANPLLWFVQHGLYDLPYHPRFGEDTRTAWEEGYLAVNRNFAEAAAELARREEADAVLLHDYQLYMTPLFLRERLGEDRFVSLFVHIPWPGPEEWRVLPRYMREGILESLLQTNVLAFHTARYARNFLDTVADVLGARVDRDEGMVLHGNRRVWVRHYPISIDPAEFEGLSRSEAVLEQEEFVRSLPGRLLLRVDRMDLSKNIVRGFLAYGRMLERHPEMRGEVTFLAQLQPSRGGVPEYAAYARAIEEAAEEVNRRWGGGGWRPIELSMQDNFPRSVAAYKNYDVLFVNAVRDGMNLVAKEAAVANETDGTLILSETAGAHEELGEYAISVNPFDLDEQAEAIYRALTMPEDERRERARLLRRAVEKNTIEDWVSDQVSDMEEYRKSVG